MARLRKFVAYRSLERPYTRRSKYRSKAYIRTNPHVRIVRFDMGDVTKDDFPFRVSLHVKADLQIRDNALESARQTSNRCMEMKAGKTFYKMKLLKFPHHILRENPLATGAGADRMSTGMKMSFGKPIGIAVQLHKGDELFRIEVPKNHVDTAREALRRAKNKLPCGCTIQVKERKVKAPKIVSQDVVEEVSA